MWNQPDSEKWRNIKSKQNYFLTLEELINGCLLHLHGHALYYLIFEQQKLGKIQISSCQTSLEENWFSYFRWFFPLVYVKRCLRYIKRWILTSYWSKWNGTLESCYIKWLAPLPGATLSGDHCADNFRCFFIASLIALPYIHSIAYVVPPFLFLLQEMIHLVALFVQK